MGGDQLGPRIQARPVVDGRGRLIICNMCGKKLRIPPGSHLEPGDRTRCPNCEAAIVV